MTDYKKFLQGLKPSLSEDIKQLNRKINELNSKVRELEEKYNTSEVLRKTLESDLKEGDEKYKKLKYKYEELKLKVKEKDNEIARLKENNNSSNPSDLNRIKELENNISKIKLDYENLLNLKDKQIIELNRIITANDQKQIMEYIRNNQNIQNNQNQNQNDNNFVLNIQSPNLNHAIICSENEIFAMVEERLCQLFEDLRETNNVFLVNGSAVKIFKTIKDNKIISGQPILLDIPGEEDQQNNNEQSQNQNNINNINNINTNNSSHNQNNNSNYINSNQNKIKKTSKVGSSIKNKSSNDKNKK